MTSRRRMAAKKARLIRSKESGELGDEVIARLNPDTGEVENLEVLFFSTRLLRSELFELPISAELRIAGGEE
jgi:hypothetical protein